MLRGIVIYRLATIKVMRHLNKMRNVYVKKTPLM